MHKYRLISKKGEGTFSEVLKAQSIKNGKYCAIKCMKNHFSSVDQVNNLREIQALRRLSPHPNVIKLYEVLYDQPSGRLALVFELMDMNIYEMIRGRRHYVEESRIKMFMYQLCKALDQMHRNGIFHRDVKPENILIRGDELKLADFGSCRGIYSKQPYTEYISTRWYRAPECLLTDGYYGYKMDMWGMGCVMFEVIALFPLFPGTNELDQIQKIHNVQGTPSGEVLERFKRQASHMDFNFPVRTGSGIAKLIPHVSTECVDVIDKLLAYDPEERLSVRQALRHPFFRPLREAEKRSRTRAPAGNSVSPQPDASSNNSGGNHGRRNRRSSHSHDDNAKDQGSEPSEKLARSLPRISKDKVSDSKAGSSASSATSSTLVSAGAGASMGAGGSSSVGMGQGAADSSARNNGAAHGNVGGGIESGRGGAGAGLGASSGFSKSQTHSHGTSSHHMPPIANKQTSFSGLKIDLRSVGGAGPHGGGGGGGGGHGYLKTSKKDLQLPRETPYGFSGSTSKHLHGMSGSKKKVAGSLSSGRSGGPKYLSPYSQQYIRKNN